MKPIVVAVLGLGLVAGAAAGGYWFARSSTTNHVEPPVAAKSKAERKVLYWYDPMQPQQRLGVDAAGRGILAGKVEHGGPARHEKVG